MTDFRYDLLPKETRLGIRAEMIRLAYEELENSGPVCTDEDRRKAAVKMVNEALARERASRN